MSESVSVVIPAFNAQAFIRTSVESVLTQGKYIAEIIVVDDGSTDCTEEVLAWFGDDIVYRKQPNAGPAAARNAGAELATGDWIAFLDADDVWLPGKLEKQLHSARHSNPGVIYANVQNVGDSEHVSTTRPLNQLPRGDIFEVLLLDNFIPLSSTMIRRDLFLAVGGFREDLLGTEDWDLWMRLAAEGIRFEVVRDPLVEYRWRVGSLSNDPGRMKQLRDRTVELALASPRGADLSWMKRQAARANALATSAWFAEQRKELKPLAHRWYASAAMTAPWKFKHWRKLARNLLPTSN